MPISESEYLSRWLATTDNLHDPQALALAGGKCADDFPWVFVAGYQAAIRATFDIESQLTAHPGWVAFAATEDRAGELPGLTITDGALNGWKTWVATADSLSHVIVIVGRGAERQALLVQRDAPGLTFDRRPGEDRFLGAMSQGRAQFNGVTQFSTLSFADLRAFAEREALFVHVAYCAYVAVQIPELADQALTLAERLPQAEEVLALLDAHESALAQQPENWQRDKNVVSMYAKR